MRTPPKQGRMQSSYTVLQLGHLKIPGKVFSQLSYIEVTRKITVRF